MVCRCSARKSKNGGFVIFTNHNITSLINLQPRIYWWKCVHASAIPLNHKTSLFLMPHCNCYPLAFHQEMLKWLLKRRERGCGVLIRNTLALGRRGLGGTALVAGGERALVLVPKSLCIGGYPESCSEDAASNVCDLRC